MIYSDVIQLSKNYFHLLPYGCEVTSLELSNFILKTYDSPQSKLLAGELARVQVLFYKCRTGKISIVRISQKVGTV